MYAEAIDVKYDFECHAFIITSKTMVPVTDILEAAADFWPQQRPPEPKRIDDVATEDCSAI